MDLNKTSYSPINQSKTEFKKDKYKSVPDTSFRGSEEIVQSESRVNLDPNYLNAYYGVKPLDKTNTTAADASNVSFKGTDNSDKIKTNIETLCEDVNISGIPDEYAEKIEAALEGIDLTEKNVEMKQKIVESMINTEPNYTEKFEHFNKWLNFIDKNFDTDLMVLPNTKMVLDKLIFDKEDPISSYMAELYEKLINNKEMTDAIKNQEYIFDNNFIQKREKNVKTLSEDELIKEEDIEPFDFEKLLKYQKQQMQLLNEKFADVEIPMDLTVEALLDSCMEHDSALKILATTSKAEIDKNLTKTDEICSKMKEKPDLYVNGEGWSSYAIESIVDVFRRDYQPALFKLFKTYDKESVELLMRKRIEDFCDYLVDLNSFDSEKSELLKKLVNSSNIDGKPFLPLQKVEFIDLMKGYIDNDLSTDELKKMLETGRVDIEQLNKDLLFQIMKNSGLNDTEIKSIPQDKLAAWDIKYVHLLSKEIKSERDPSFGDIFRAANLEPDFMAYIHKSDNIYGQANAITKAKYEESGLNYDKWLKPSKENEVHFVSTDQNSERLSQITAQIKEDMDTLMQGPVKGFLKKQFPKFVKGNEFVIPLEYATNKAKLAELVKMLSDTSEQGQLTQVWKRAQSNAENPDPNRAAIAKNTLTILDHLNQRLDDISHVSDEAITKKMDLTIKMWDRAPQKDIFQGNYSTCCIAMGGSNGRAMPHYIVNTAYNMIEINDNNTGKTIGNALCYFIKDNDGNPAFIIDNIEINTRTKPSDEVGKQLRSALVEYASNVSKEVTGRVDTHIYMSSDYNDVPWEDLESKSEKVTLLGDTDCDEIYMDLYEGWVDKSNYTAFCNLYKLK